MSSAKIFSGEPCEEIKKGIEDLLAIQKQQAAELDSSQKKVSASETAVQALRVNLDGLDKLLQKEAANLDQDDQKAAKVVAKLKTLQRKAKKALRQHDRPAGKARKQAIVPQEPAKECSPEHPLLQQVEQMAHFHAQELRQQKRRLWQGVAAIVLLPVAGFIVGLQVTTSSTDKVVPPVVPAGAPLGGQLTAPVQPVVKPQYFYTVKPGDTLSKLAEFFYGDSGQWSKLYEANKEKIANPNQIETGQQLLIP